MSTVWPWSGGISPRDGSIFISVLNQSCFQTCHKIQEDNGPGGRARDLTFTRVTHLLKININKWVFYKRFTGSNMTRGDHKSSQTWHKLPTAIEIKHTHTYTYTYTHTPLCALPITFVLHHSPVAGFSMAVMWISVSNICPAKREEMFGPWLTHIRTRLQEREFSQRSREEKGHSQWGGSESTAPLEKQLIWEK